MSAGLIRFILFSASLIDRARFTDEGGAGARDFRFMFCFPRMPFLPGAAVGSSIFSMNLGLSSELDRSSVGEPG